MLRAALAFDAAMTAHAALERLAIHGFWLRIDHPVVRARLEALSKRLGTTVEAVAATLARDPAGHGAAIRRQWGTRVLWYPRDLAEVLERCWHASPADSLLRVLDLHETDAPPTIALGELAGETTLTTAVVMDNGAPVAISIIPRSAAAAMTGYRGGGEPHAQAQAQRSELPRSRALKGEPPKADGQEAPIWPRIDSPDAVPALQPFNVVVGFGAERQEGTWSAPVTIDDAPEAFELRVELASGPGVEATAGWSRTMRVARKDILSAQVSFELKGKEPADADRPVLTTLEVRYLIDGAVCGAAARPLVILRAGALDIPSIGDHGEDWKKMGRAATPITLARDERAPDLTIEITKPDHNAASGHYTCQLFSPHALATPRGPFSMDLGNDAKTFAKSLVDEVRLYSANALLGVTLEAQGLLVAQCLPHAVFEALREVAAKVAPRVPAVMIVSAEPYVPWELAWIDPPLDKDAPQFLGAQAVVGRWLRDADARPSDAAQRPAAHPISSLKVRNIAVMAAWYKAATGLRRLPMAENEAQAIVQGWQGVPLAAMAGPVRDLLQANLHNGFTHVGGVEAVHFAGHGDFDPTRPDSSALFLQDGTPLRSNLFRAARYGGERQPLMFLNACMLGIGGELLGDMAGFPGNSLRGGFGGVIGALWEVDDTVAHNFALEFWERALPKAPAAGEPVGEILRDLRAKYLPAKDADPVSTYLAYVYYGHPRLTLERAA